MQTKTTIKCLCGREVALEIEGGQYQDTYRGDCECGRKWVLTEISEAMKEIDDCGLSEMSRLGSSQF